MVALSIPRLLFWIACLCFFSVSQQTAEFIVVPWGKNSTKRTPCVSQNTVHVIFLVENIWTFSFSASQYASSARIAVLIQMWYGTPMSRLLSHGSTCHILPCDSAFEMSKHMQHAVFCAPLCASWAPIVHTFSDNPNDYWQCHRVLEIWGKCKDRSGIVKRLSSRTLSLTLRTKSSFTKDGRTLCASSCTFCLPSLNNWTNFLTTPSFITLSPYTWQIWWWISLGSTFLVFKKWITDLFHSRRPLQLS